MRQLREELERFAHDKAEQLEKILCMQIVAIQGADYFLPLIISKIYRRIHPSGREDYYYNGNLIVSVETKFEGSTLKCTFRTPEK
jgi:hypothetical protein